MSEEKHEEKKCPLCGHVYTDYAICPNCGKSTTLNTGCAILTVLGLVGVISAVVFALTR